MQIAGKQTLAERRHRTSWASATLWRARCPINGCLGSPVIRESQRTVPKSTAHPFARGRSRRSRSRRQEGPLADGFGESEQSITDAPVTRLNQPSPACGCVPPKHGAAYRERAFCRWLLLGMQIRLNMGEKSAHFSLLGLRPRPRTRREAVGGVEKPTPPTGR